MYVCMYVGIHVYLHISGCIIMCGGGRVRDLIEPTSCLPTVAGPQPSGHSFAPLPRCSCMAGIRASVGWKGLSVFVCTSVCMYVFVYVHV
jgi:hypothetical protein